VAHLLAAAPPLLLLSIGARIQKKQIGRSGPGRSESEKPEEANPKKRLGANRSERSESLKASGRQSDRSERSDPRGANQLDLLRGCGDASKEGASTNLPPIDSSAFPVGSPPRTSAGAVEGTVQFVAPG